MGKKGKDKPKGRMEEGAEKTYKPKEHNKGNKGSNQKISKGSYERELSKKGEEKGSGTDLRRNGGKQGFFESKARRNTSKES